MYLIFDNKQDAESANNQISQNMGLTGDVTNVWDIPQETADGKFVITKPENRFMTDVSSYQEVESYQSKEIMEG